MKEIVKVSISGLAFDLENAAYTELSGYLSRLEEGYKDNPDGAEIIADIEARIVELILSQQDMRMAVGDPLIHSVIEQLGMPDDIGSGAGDDGKYAPPAVASERFPKRLYRNPEGAKLGGVCSGLGTYFGVDPVWIRVGIFAPILLCIIFGVLHFHQFTSLASSLFATFVLLYFILWIAIPLAKNPRQQLEMRGERITASSIESAAQEYPREKIYRSASGADRAMGALGRVLLFCIKAFVLLIGIGFAVAAIALIIVILSMPWSDAIADISLTLPYGASSMSGTAFITLALTAVLIPFIMLVYGIICLVFGCKVNKPVMWVLGVGWFLIVVFTGVVGVRNNGKLADQKWFYGKDRFEYRWPNHRHHMTDAGELKHFENL